ncbi:MAG: OmpA family protein [Treponema sp.]|nr:OmpA family protein [Treponema sp.]MDY3755876.1 OmpA family protein [Treponema sp.]
MRRGKGFVFKRVAFVLLVSSLGASIIFAQNSSGNSVVTTPSTGGSVQLAHSFSGNYTLVERSNWSQYVNGRYIGLTSREVHGFMNPVGTGSWRGQWGTEYTGDFYVFQQTKRNSITAAAGIDDISPSTFVMLQDGSIQFTEMCFYPQLRNFPVFPQDKVKKGSRWQGTAERVIDPRNNNQYTVLEVPVEYEFVGEELYEGSPVYRIKAKFATRFNRYNPPRIIDSELTQATGTHDVDILVDKETCAVMMILDRLDETFTYRNGETIRYKGTTSLFTKIPVQVDKRELYERAVYIARGEEPPASSSLGKKDETGKGASSSKTGSSGIGSGGTEKNSVPGTATSAVTDDGKGLFQVEDTDKGVRLSVRDLQFVADSSQLLPQEKERLDAVAEVLKSVPDGTFLIEGHTAAVGRAAGEQQLSEERAQSVIKEMVKRGLKEDQFMFRGYGGTRPVGDNNTDAGRAANRRVEITILQ